MRLPRRKQLGHMIHLQDDIIQINDFLPPGLFREALSFGENHLSKFGSNYNGEMAPIDSSFTQKILDLLASKGLHYNALESARLRVGTPDDIHDFRSLVHVDHQCKSVLVVYLENSLYKKPAEAGTIFWEHNSTKKRKLDLTDSRGVFLHDLILRRDTTDLSQWKEWLNCPFQENSALIFNGLYFHSPPHPGWEKSGTGKRITLDLFLN